MEQTNGDTTQLDRIEAKCDRIITFIEEFGKVLDGLDGMIADNPMLKMMLGGKR